METAKITNYEQDKVGNEMSESNSGIFPPPVPSNRVKRPVSSHASVTSAPDNNVNNGVTATSIYSQKIEA